MQARGSDRLSEDAFEALMDHFEKALQAALQQRTELWPGLAGASASALPDVADALPLEQALEGQVRGGQPLVVFSQDTRQLGALLQQF